MVALHQRIQLFTEAQEIIQAIPYPFIIYTSLSIIVNFYRN